MDREIGVLLANGTNKARQEMSMQWYLRFAGVGLHLGGLWLQQTCHILDTKDVDSFCNQLIDEVEVILQRVLCFFRARHPPAHNRHGEHCKGD